MHFFPQGSFPGALHEVLVAPSDTLSGKERIQLQGFSQHKISKRAVQLNHQKQMLQVG